MARYSVLRLMIFFGFVSALWLLGVRNQVSLLVISALGSATLSYFVLAGPRAQLSAKIATRVDQRARRLERRHQDEIDEDVETEDSSPRA